MLKFHKKPISSFNSQPISTNKVLNERISKYLKSLEPDFWISILFFWNWTLKFQYWCLEIIYVKISQKTYLLLHFSTDFDNQGLKWKKKSIPKRFWSPIFEFQFGFSEIRLWIWKMMTLNFFFFIHQKPISSFISQPISTNKVSNERRSRYLNSVEPDF